MKPFRIGIRTKVLLLLIGLLVVIFGIAALVFVQSTIRSLRQTLTSEAQSFAELATQPIGKTFLLYKDSGTVRIDQQISQFTSLDNTISGVVIYNLSGSVVYKQNSVPLPKVTAAQASSFNREYISGAGGELAAVIQPFIEDTGVHRYGVLYTISNSQINQSIRDGVLAILVFAFLAIMVVSFVLFVAINQLFLRPVSRLSASSLAISSGRLDQPIKEERHDEIGDLARSVNTMAQSLKADIVKLEEVDKLKTEFMMITSHNLRTPLSIINGYLDNLKTMKLSGELSAMIDTIAANSTRLGTLAEDILTISQIEAGQEMAMAAEKTDLVKITDQMAAECRTLASKRQQQFDYNAPKQAIMIHAGVPQVRQAVWNLLDNALKFTEAGGKVSVSVRSGNGQALIAVSDTGIGISTDELPKLFTKFHRGTSTLQYDYEGVGIGLYISRLIVREFKGDITVKSTLGQGSTFTVSLPLQTSA